MSEGGRRFVHFNGKLIMSMPTTSNVLPGEHIGMLDLATVVPDTCVAVSSTGMAEHQALAALAAYPNPVGSELWLALPTDEVHLDILLTDAAGRLVKTQRTVWQERMVMNTSGIAPGSYLVTVHGRTGRLGSARIIMLH